MQKDSVLYFFELRILTVRIYCQCQVSKSKKISSMKNEVKFKNLEYTSHSQASTEMKMSLLGLFKLLLKYSL